MANYKCRIDPHDWKEVEADNPEEAQRAYLVSIGALQTDKAIECIDTSAPEPTPDEPTEEELRLAAEDAERNAGCPTKAGEKQCTLGAGHDEPHNFSDEE